MTKLKDRQSHETELRSMTSIRKSLPIRRKNSDLPVVISLFAGAGGLDLGFKQSGYKIGAAFDISQAAIRTHKKNFPTTKSFVADLIDLGPDGLLELISKVVPEGSKVGVIGGPPCQGFSRANTNSRADDPRNSLPALYLEIVEKLQAQYSVEFVVFENVLGIRDKKHSQTYKNLLRGLSALNFEVSENELCSLDFGVPQKRRRIIIAGICEKKWVSEISLRRRKGKSTVQEAIGGLGEPAFFQRGLTAKDIPVHPNHWTMQPKSHRFSQGSDFKSASRSFRKLSWSKPSPTIAFGNREIHVHPSGKRRLSIYEAMLLQGFPDTFVLEGNLSEQVQQISNAVPPPLALSVANAVKRSISN